MSIAVLISGRGSNLKAIVDAGLPVSMVISNRRDARGLDYAKNRGIETAVVADADYHTREEADKQLAKHLTKAAPHIIALAGFMRVLGADIVRAFGDKMINIHPSLLPQFRGLHTHRRALAAGVREHGCTVHRVSEGIDEGEIIGQKEVPVYPTDDEQSLGARVLKQEHILYPRVLASYL